MPSTTSLNKPSVLGGILGGVLGAFSAGTVVGIAFFIIGMTCSARIDEAQGHPGGESGAGFIALFTVFGSVGAAILCAGVGAVIGAACGATGASIPKRIGLGALIGGTLVGPGFFLWFALLSGGFSGGSDPIILIALFGVGVLAGVVGGVIAGAIGGMVGVRVHF
ncbi:MAG TPA: hypothetical protein VH682_17375 [Gemmataceae bacterium]